MTRQFSAAMLIGLVLGYGGPSTLGHLEPTTLATHGPALRLPAGSSGYAWARRRDTLAVYLRGAGTGYPIHVVDARTLRVRRSIAVGDRDVCGLTFRGPWLLALVSDGACFFSSAREEILKIDPAAGRVVATTPVRAIVRAIFPTNLAFGDGYAFAADAAGVTAIDLHTGAVTRHAPRRVPAKGGFVQARWLGDHLLSAGGRLVDVRTWSSRRLMPGARTLVPAGRDVVALGSRGGAVFTRSGRLVRHVLGAEDVTDGWVRGPLLYAMVGAATDVVDLRTGTRIRVVPELSPQVFLEP